MKWRTIIAAVVAVLAVIGGMYFGAWLKGEATSSAGNPVATATQDPTTVTPPATKPATTTPSATNVPATPKPTKPTTSSNTPVAPTKGTLPEAANGSLTQWREPTDLFNGIATIPHTPLAWNGMSSDGDSAQFADVSGCTGSDRSCPHITFMLLVGPNKANYGSNPVVAWAHDVCSARSSDSVQTAAFTAGGESATYYKFPCQGTEYHSWFVPGKKVFVTAQDTSDGQTVDPNIVQAVMEHLVWS